MGLTLYKKKRSFKETPEPQGGKAGKQQLRFVIQKHDASHLHYDFRLEMEGVLKSWAVPKGPSTDPKVKRLAMMVEDHPFNYRSFEGIIPKGNYGGGTVIVWDEGTYEDAELPGKSKKDQDKSLRHQLHAGKIKFTLKGEKLKGTFALIKSHGRGENAWLLMKLKDEHVSASDILKKDRSVISEQTIEEVAATSENIYGQKASSKKVKAALKTPVKKIAVKKKSDSKTLQADYLKDAPAIKFPSALKPMLATLVDKPFDREGWIYEIKWDGYRALAFMQKDRVELKSRNDKPFNEKFYPVFNALKEWNVNAIVDGEIVVIDKNGLSNFGALQNWRSEADGQLIFYAFDLLWLDGKDIASLPLLQRHELLAQLIPKDHDIIRVSDIFHTSGTEFFSAAQKMGLEGIIAKKADSIYHANNRSTDWLKIKANKRQEMVIGGYTHNNDSSKEFSALLVGVYEGKKLIYTGKIGTGFSDKLQKEMMKQFKPLISKVVPFDSEPDVNKPSRFRPNPPNAVATWLKPELVCEVSYAEMTSDGVMRHPSFEGMRTDKKAKDVIKETEAPVKNIVEKKGKKKADEPVLTPPSKNDRKTLLNPTEETQVKKINGHELKFTNLSKIFWPEEKYTKRDLINYYYQVAPYILPWLKDRPQSLNRHPNGITGKSFYQKDVTGKAPEWIETFLYHSDADARDKHFMVVTDEASILYMVSLGCIELNPWSSRVDKPDNPDWCIIDLDPDKEKSTFEHVIEAAQVTKQVLDDLAVPSYCKTSGSSGLHIYIPLGAKYTYEQSKEFARVVVTLVQKEIPKFTSLERTVANRGGKMYLDFLQNRSQATIAAPYSVRPKPGATVSMPLHWDEVKKGLKMKDFTIMNALERIKSEGDIFKPVLGKGIDLEKISGAK